MSEGKPIAKKLEDSEDILRLYLKEISKIPLLTREQEVELGRRAKNGDAEAMDKLVKSNLRFVVSIAKKYASSGVPLLDLINEGNIGLIEAAKRFDPEKANRFITYAKWWIQQSIRSAVAAQAGIVRLPTKQRMRLSMIKAAYQRLQDELDRAPTSREVADAVGLSVGEVETLLRASTEAVSLESSKEVGAELADLDLEEFDPSGETEVERAVILQSYVENLREIIKELSPTEQKVITLRFGLQDGQRRSLESVGNVMGLSRERIRQIEEVAKRKIRSIAKAKNLSVVLN